MRAMSKSSEKISVKGHVRFFIRDMVDSLCRRGAKSEMALRDVAKDLKMSPRKLKDILYGAVYWKISEEEIKRISDRCYSYVDDETDYWVQHNTVRLAEKRNEIKARLQECQLQDSEGHGSGVDLQKPQASTQSSGSM